MKSLVQFNPKKNENIETSMNSNEIFFRKL
jgi:hypothetical protein